MPKASNQPVKPASWFVYLLKCRDGSLYCGITTDIPRRLAQHNGGTGAKYMVPSRRPAECVWKRRARDQSQALGLEHWLKQLSAETKRRLAEKSVTLRLRKSGEWKLAAGKTIRAQDA